MKRLLLEHVLRLMDKKEIKLEKITIQKVIYFLKETGIPIQYKYEPYIYGPYSSELKSDLNNLVLFGNLSKVDNQYSINCEPEDLFDEDSLKRISEKIDALKNAIKNNFGFDSMEITGTIIYCHQALKKAGLAPNKENVLDEFKNWKGSRYDDAQINSYFSKIAPLLN